MVKSCGKSCGGAARNSTGNSSNTVKTLRTNGNMRSTANSNKMLQVYTGNAGDKNNSALESVWGARQISSDQYDVAPLAQEVARPHPGLLPQEKGQKKSVRRPAFGIF
jgi:hypothetical protein